MAISCKIRPSWQVMRWRGVGYVGLHPWMPLATAQNEGTMCNYTRSIMLLSLPIQKAPAFLGHLHTLNQTNSGHPTETDPQFTHQKWYDINSPRHSNVHPGICHKSRLQTGWCFLEISMNLNQEKWKCRISERVLVWFFRPMISKI